MSGIDTAHTDKRCDAIQRQFNATVIGLERRLAALERNVAEDQGHIQRLLRQSEGRQGTVADEWVCRHASCHTSRSACERDTAREKLGHVNARLYEVTAERDAALARLAKAERERDATTLQFNTYFNKLLRLQERLSALATREPTLDDLASLSDKLNDWMMNRHNVRARHVWIHVRDALLTVQGP